MQNLIDLGGFDSYEDLVYAVINSGFNSPRMRELVLGHKLPSGTVNTWIRKYWGLSPSEIRGLIEKEENNTASERVMNGIKVFHRACDLIGKQLKVVEYFHPGPDPDYCYHGDFHGLYWGFRMNFHAEIPVYISGMISIRRIPYEGFSEFNFWKYAIEVTALPKTSDWGPFIGQRLGRVRAWLYLFPGTEYWEEEKVYWHPMEKDFVSDPPGELVDMELIFDNKKSVYLSAVHINNYKGVLLRPELELSLFFDLESAQKYGWGELEGREVMILDSNEENSEG